MKKLVFPLSVGINIAKNATKTVSKLKAQLTKNKIAAAKKSVFLLNEFEDKGSVALALYYSAMISYIQKDYQKSSNYLVKLINMHSNCVPFITSLSYMYFLLGQTEKSVGLALHGHKLMPKNPDILIFIAERLISFSQFGEAYKALLAVQSIKNSADYELDSKRAMCLSRLTFEQYSQAVENDLIQLFRKGQVDCKFLVKAATSTLWAKYDSNVDSVDLTLLAKDELLICLLSNTLITDLRFENVLIVVRRRIFEAFTNQCDFNEIVNLAIAISIQNFMNEYIHFIDEGENKLLKDISNSGLPIEAFFMRAMYIEPALDSFKEQCLINDLAKCFKITVFDSRDQEEQIKLTLSSSQSLEADNTNIHTQYEENPYPRWFNCPTHKKSSFYDYIVRQMPHIDASHLKTIKRPKVLIAGCGTGKQAISFALNFPNTDITAIDISLSSLAYAKRRSQELKISNIKFLQLSLLDVESLNQSFDVIECCGVLHHLTDPIEGFQSLNKVLRKNGVMKLALYSRLARTEVSQVRKLFPFSIEQVGLSNIRNTRHQIISGDLWQGVNYLAQFRDFYSTSGTRDLLFNALEHQVDIDWLSDTLNLINKKFKGFQFETFETLLDFKKSYPDVKSELNLELWKRYEELNTKTFASMYTFWCQ